MKQFLKNKIVDLRAGAFRLSHRAMERLKFTDSRRKRIYRTVRLTRNQKQEILRLYRDNYGSRIPTVWHRYYTAFTGRFDPGYFPELLFIPEFEAFMNLRQEYAAAMEDKNLIALVADAAGVRMPDTVLSCAAGIFRDENRNRCSLHQARAILAAHTEPLFMKPSVDSCSGQGCSPLQFQQGRDLYSGRTPSEILQALGDHFIIQKRLQCHASLSELYAGSVNTFRFTTYRWKDDFFMTPVILRIGQGGNYLDNAHAGGMFIGVDENGRLLSRAFTEFRREYTCHPDSHTVFEGRCIPGFRKVTEAALRLHGQIPQLGCIHWDLTLDAAGEPILIEANTRAGGIWPCQMAHGVGPFGDRTPEILRWMKKMKGLPASQREAYAFGRNMDPDAL